MKLNTLTFLVCALIIYTTANAQECQRIFISEYVAGTGNNKAVEIYNPTGEPIDLDGYVLERWSNGEQSATDQLNLEGIIPAFGTWVVVNGQTEDIDLGTFISPACDPALQALADQLDNPYPAPTFFNGNDVLLLVNYSESAPVFDIFGKPGQDPGAGWTDPDGNNITALQTLIRKAEVTQGVTIPPVTFMPLDEWVPIGTDNWSNLGTHDCNCDASCNVNINLGDTLSYCNLESAVLDAGVGYASYFWSTGENTSSIEVNGSGTYTVQVFDDAGCSAIDSVYVDFLSVNILQQDILVAPGQSVFIEVEVSNSDQLSYLWSNGATTPIIEVNPTQNTTYTVAVSNGITTCTDNVSVTVFCEVDGGILEVTNPMTEFCVGDNSPNLISVQVSGNSGLGTYGVVDANSFDIVGGSINGTFNFENYPPGDYFVGYVSYLQPGFLAGKENISDFDGCFDVSNLIGVSTYTLEGGVITANESNTFCLGEGAPTNLSFSVSGKIGPNFRWALLNQAFSEVILSNQSGTFNIQNLNAGVYRVVHVAFGDEVILGQVDPQNIMGCVDVSNSLSVILLDCGGIVNLDIKTNPVSHNSSVIFSNSEGGMALLEIYDISGRLIRSVYNGYAEEAVEYQIETDLSDLNNGVYLYRLTTDQTVVTEKFIVSR
jgi:hypothetical protein